MSNTRVLSARRVALRVAALTVAAFAPALAQAPKPDYVQVVRKDAERRVDIIIGGQPFTSYIWPESQMKPVLYPIRAASGTIITRGYPLEPRANERTDHPHHAGLWFNYGDVNGLDFWNNSTAIPAAQASKMGTIKHLSVNKVVSGQGEGSLSVTTEWVDHTGKKLLKEDATFIFRASEGMRSIDRITTLTALGDSVSFKDNKEGVIGMRMARELEHPSTQKDKFLDAQGRETTVAVMNNEGVTGMYLSSEGKTGDAVWGTRGRWTTLTGVIKGDTLTVAMLDHPKNPGFPTYWHARGYGLFAANPLGQAALSNGKDTLNYGLGAGKSVTFRHQILVLNGARTPAQMEQYYNGFTK